ncbi:MAG: DUF354 domain-containing protein, partial [Actinomycetia bacterium]|nr:DUF354 domain-containing protein [Actinomycetes bacterium]
MSFRKRKSFNKKRIWLDITNSPHVLFFYPLIKEFEKREYEVIITTRDYAQVLSLLNRFHMKYKLIGKHQGKSILKKALGFVFRSLRLFVFGMGKKFDLALSHSSNDLSIAAFALRIPSVVMFDYEFAELSHRVNLRLATKILIPDLIPTEALNKYGNIKNKIDKYRGLKEQVYLGFMDIDENI